VSAPASACVRLWRASGARLARREGCRGAPHAKGHAYSCGSLIRRLSVCGIRGVVVCAQASQPSGGAYRLRAARDSYGSKRFEQKYQTMALGWVVVVEGGLCGEGDGAEDSHHPFTPPGRGVCFSSPQEGEVWWVFECGRILSSLPVTSFCNYEVSSVARSTRPPRARGFHRTQH
jgi:hypothetical protein